MPENDEKREWPGEHRLATGETWHLCAYEHWIEHARSRSYVPEQFARDGFIHCTNEATRLIEIANHYYRNDPRPYVALKINLNAVPARAVYEDSANEFPHIYGDLPVESVINVLPVERGEGGTFKRLEGLGSSRVLGQQGD